MTADGIGPKLEAWLETPDSVRDGRIFTAWLCYKNSGDADMTMPLFEVSCNATTQMSYTKDGEYSSHALRYGGISPTTPAGILKAGEENRVPVFFKIVGSYELTLSSNDGEEISDDSWMMKMAEAATLLNKRGREEYRISEMNRHWEYVDEGIPFAFCGTLWDVSTEKPLIGVEVRVKDSEGKTVSWDTSDSNGRVVLERLSNNSIYHIECVADDYSLSHDFTLEGGCDILGQLLPCTPARKLYIHVSDENEKLSENTTVNVYGANGECYTASINEIGECILNIGNASGELFIVVRDDDRFDVWESITVSPNSYLSSKEILITKDQDMAILVLNEDGQPVSDATIVLSDEYGEKNSFRTSETGSWSGLVPVGQYMLYAYCSGYGKSTPQAVEIKANESKSLELHLAKRSCTVTGTVKKDGSPVSGGNVTIVCSRGNQEIVPIQEDGTYTCLIEKNLEYMVRAYSDDDDYSQWMIVRCDTEGESKTIDLSLSPMVGWRCALVNLTEDEVKNGYLSLKDAISGESIYPVLDSECRFICFLPPGQYYLQGSFSGYVFETRYFIVEDNRDFELTLSKGGNLTCTVDADKYEKVQIAHDDGNIYTKYVNGESTVNMNAINAGQGTVFASGDGVITCYGFVTLTENQNVQATPQDGRLLTIDASDIKESLVIGVSLAEYPDISCYCNIDDGQVICQIPQGMDVILEWIDNDGEKICRQYVGKNTSAVHVSHQNPMNTVTGQITYGGVPLESAVITCLNISSENKSAACSDSTGMFSLEYPDSAQVLWISAGGIGGMEASVSDFQTEGSVVDIPTVTDDNATCVTLMTRNNKPLAGAALQLEDASGRFFTGSTDVDGKALLLVPSGSYKLIVSLGDDVVCRKDVNVSPASGNMQISVDVSCEDGSIIVVNQTRSRASWLKNMYFTESHDLRTYYRNLCNLDGLDKTMPPVVATCINNNCDYNAKLYRQYLAWRDVVNYDLEILLSQCDYLDEKEDKLYSKLIDAFVKQIPVLGTSYSIVTSFKELNVKDLITSSAQLGSNINGIYYDSLVSEGSELSIRRSMAARNWYYYKSVETDIICKNLANKELITQYQMYRVLNGKTLLNTKQLQYLSIDDLISVSPKIMKASANASNAAKTLKLIEEQIKSYKFQGHLMSGIGTIFSIAEAKDDIINFRDYLNELNAANDELNRLEAKAIEHKLELVKILNTPYHECPASGGNGGSSSGGGGTSGSGSSNMKVSDRKGGKSKQSCDPNEISGIVGFGDSGMQRFVKPGEWLDYTVYFENKSTAAAPAQEVMVTHQLSQWLDWSTLELGEIVFNNQIQLELKGKARGTVTIPQTNASYDVKITAATDEATGEFTLYMRSWDKTRQAYNYWPESVYAGFLPPNDETHCGEGHFTFRVKIREDAPNGACINAEATIVFDMNAPITTSPAWFNWVTTDENAATDNSTLRWDTSEDADGTTYQVNIWAGDPEMESENATVIATSDTLTTGRWKMPANLVPGTYFWNVTKTNGDDVSHTSTWSFDVVLFGVTVTNTIGNIVTFEERFAPGDAVTVTAPEAPDGKVFARWRASGLELTEEQTVSETISFNMPSATVQLLAYYKNEFMDDDGIHPADFNSDLRLTRSEMEAYLADVLAVVAGSVEGYYSWDGVELTPEITAQTGSQIHEADTDGNGRISVLEYAEYKAPLLDVVTNGAYGSYEWDGETLMPAAQLRNLYVVVDLSGGPSAPRYPVRYSTTGPDMTRDFCRTTELWLRRIPAGTFIMGSPEDEVGHENNETQHKVTLSHDYYMGVFEITQRQWELVMGTRPSWFSNASCYATRPVEEITYDMIRGDDIGAGWPQGGHAVDATSFMGILQAKTGVVFDLPTEAQWEYACRAETTTALNSGENRITGGSCEAMNKVGRYYFNGGEEDAEDCTTDGGTAKVGSYLPNTWGLYDMHGNIMEWTLDYWAETMTEESVTDPLGPETGDRRVLKGGPYYWYSPDCRSASKTCRNPSDTDDGIGFRVSCGLFSMKYMVVDLSGGTSVEFYPIRYSGKGPDLNNDTCRTTELWLRRIPAGTFMMGSPEDEIGRSPNETQHKVTLTEDYYIGVFEFTQKQYELVTGSNPSLYRGDCRPVEQISYNTLRGAYHGANYPKERLGLDYDSFMGIIRRRTGLAFDLPTEAQWEYACRARTTTALNSGKNLTNSEEDDAMSELGRYGYNNNDGKGGYDGEHTKVGSYRPNGWGLYDMHGNVWEWTLDWYGDYGTEPVNDPAGQWRGNKIENNRDVGDRVLRGGCYGATLGGVASQCRSAQRGYTYTDGRVNSFTYGFRIACGTDMAAYMVVDLSGGPSAESYPIRYSAIPPFWINGDNNSRTSELWLRRIPAGTFMMGAPEGELGRIDNETQHEVTLTKDYYIGIYECTQGQWELVMGNNPSKYKNNSKLPPGRYYCRPVDSCSYYMIRGSSPTGGAGWPMYGHSVDADSFMGRLQAKTGLTFDLPTEAQWEYACRAGTTTSLNSGVNITSASSDSNLAILGRYYYNQGKSDGYGLQEHAVAAAFYPNAWGLYDMHGNVLEWVLDRYDLFTSDKTVDPTGPLTGAPGAADDIVGRVMRGGDWATTSLAGQGPAALCRSAFRCFVNTPTTTGFGNCGFRIACHLFSQ